VPTLKSYVGNTLSAALNATDTTCTLNDGSDFPTGRRLPYFVDIFSGSDPKTATDRETVLVKGVAGNTLTIVRGMDGTGAVSHSSGHNVILLGSAANLMSGRWVDLESYDVKGDNSTDDTDAVWKAISEAPANATVYVRNGRYRLTNWTTVASAIDKPLTIVMESEEAIMQGVGGVQTFLRIGSELRIEGGRFDDWLEVINLGDVDSAIEYVTIRGARFTANRSPIYWASADANGVVKRFEVADCTASGTISSFCIFEGKVDAADIRNNRIWEGDNGFRIGKDDGTLEDDWSHIAFIGNSINNIATTGGTSAGLLAYGHNCVFIGNRIDGVYTPDNESWGIYTKCRQATINGNVIRHVRTDSSLAGTGIRVKGRLRGTTNVSPYGHMVSVMGNAIDGINIARTEGISIHVSEVVCAGNVIDRVTQAGIGGGSEESSHVHVFGNLIRFESPATNSSGIECVNKDGRWKIERNKIVKPYVGLRLTIVSGGADPREVFFNENEILNVEPNGMGIKLESVTAVDDVFVEKNLITGTTYSRGIQVQNTAMGHCVIYKNRIRGGASLAVNFATVPTDLEYTPERPVRGTGSVTSVGSFVVSFGETLPVTPVAEDIDLVFTTDTTRGYLIHSITTTQFEIEAKEVRNGFVSADFRWKWNGAA